MIQFCFNFIVNNSFKFIRSTLFYANLNMGLTNKLKTISIQYYAASEFLLRSLANWISTCFFISWFLWFDGQSESKVMSKCADGMLQCMTSTNSSNIQAEDCFLPSQRCDGQRDCNDDSDEIGCDCKSSKIIFISTKKKKYRLP